MNVVKWLDSFQSWKKTELMKTLFHLFMGVPSNILEKEPWFSLVIMVVESVEVYTKSLGKLP